MDLPYNSNVIRYSAYCQIQLTLDAAASDLIHDLGHVKPRGVVTKPEVIINSHDRDTKWSHLAQHLPQLSEDGDKEINYIL